MGKYSTRSKEKETVVRNTVNPYMRGIGCLFMLIVPVFSYFAGYELAEMRIGAGLLPPEWFGYMSIPPALANFSGLNYIAGFLAKQPHLSATLAFGLVTLVVVGGIVSIIFGYMYSVFAPSKYGPMDVPPPRVRTKKYKR